MSDEESTNGICDHCHERIEVCKCDDIHCPKCEDALPRNHKCAKDPTHCEYCGESVDDCECKPSDRFD
jgi:hypothetical protein